MSTPTGSLRNAHRTCALFPVALGVGLVMALAGVAFASAQVAAVEPASRVVEVEVPAPSLEGNLLGTPSVQGRRSTCRRATSSRPSAAIR